METMRGSTQYHGSVVPSSMCWELIKALDTIGAYLFTQGRDDYNDLSDIEKNQAKKNYAVFKDIMKGEYDEI